VTLSHEVECDEAYVIAGHKGQPEVVKSTGRKGRRRRLKGKAGRGTLQKEKPPIFGMMQRGGQVVITLLENVKQKTIDHWLKRPLLWVRLCTRMSTVFMRACVPGGMIIRASIMDEANLLAMKMATACVKCT
jgi:hypothetical protein